MGAEDDSTTDGPQNPLYEAQLRLFVESVVDYAILMLDGDGHVASWNVGAERIKGYKADEIIGQHFSRFYTDEDLADGKPQRALREAAANGRWEDEGWRVRKDGSQFWASVVITALRDDTGSVVGYGKVTRDLTERKEAERRELEQAHAISARRAEFLTLASHHILGPAAVLEGNASLLLAGGLSPEDERRCLNALTRQASKVTDFARQLAALASLRLDDPWGPNDIAWFRSDANDQPGS